MNPLRDILERSGRSAADRPSPFRAEAETVLNGFREGRRELEQRVKRGDMTPKVAREQAAAEATRLARALKERAGEYSETPRVFLDRIVEASKNRATAGERMSLEGLQRETNRLLRSVVIEQQIQARQAEFEGRTYVRPGTGGQPAPTLDSLLSFRSIAQMAGDEAGLEWTRRKLEGFRPLAGDPETMRKIDLATERPDRVNPRVVSSYIEAMSNAEPGEMERFVAESIASKDTNACMAAFVLARQAAEGSRLRWVRMVLEGINDFPDVALTNLRELETSARVSDREAALAQAEFISAQAGAEAKLPGLEAPTAEELARRAEIEARPVAKLGEPIGLALDRRGVLPGEKAGLEGRELL